ncbi:MAG: hypothetical protein ISS82_01695 [Nanoarchaeota archaeon]|nr:hypothetical protein [Nanoarchaeota archaeon]
MKKMKMYCWKCKTSMKKIKDKFHGFKVDAWKCTKCHEIIYDEKNIQPILQYNKLKESKKELTTTVGVLGKSKIFRIPKIAEQLYGVYKGEKLKFDLKPNEITIKIKS